MAHCSKCSRWSGSYEVKCPDCGRGVPGSVLIHGNVKLGQNVSVCEPADINGTDSSITIGDGADIAAFVSINCADSHRKAIGLSKEIERKPIVIEHNVFIGQGATILGGCNIGHHSVIGAGVILKNARIPPYSRVKLPEPIIEGGFYDQ